MITIINYKSCNPSSIANMIKKIGCECVIANVPAQISTTTTHLILPGIGSFHDGMKNLHELGFVEILNDLVINKKIPILGICLGMQIMAQSSEEGYLPGLGWINGKLTKFLATNGLRVPHMGWNYVEVKKPNKLLDVGSIIKARFYFAHSFYLTVDNQSDILATTKYGGDFVSAIWNGNIYGVQFHPEKSHKYGMNLISNFLKV